MSAVLSHPSSALPSQQLPVVLLPSAEHREEQGEVAQGVTSARLPP